MKCPLFKKPCIKHECEWYTHILGQSPQTDETYDKWGCAIAWMPVLMIETAKESRQTAASVDSFRNEVVKLNKLGLKMQKEALKLDAKR